MRTPEQEDSYELHVLRDAMAEKHGHFVSLILEAAQVADADNFELMRPFLRAFIRKYDLRCSLSCQRDGTGWKGEVPGWVTEAKPTPTSDVEINLYLEGLDHAIEDAKDEIHKTFYRNLKTLISDLRLESEEKAGMAREAREKLDGASRLLAEHGFVQTHQVEMNDFAAALQLLDRIASESY